MRSAWRRSLWRGETSVDGLVQLACRPSRLEGDRRPRDRGPFPYRARRGRYSTRHPRQATGWTMARWIAVSLNEGVIPPEEGARRLWSLASECGYPGELVEMLQLHESAWESSVGPDQAAVEAEILASAPEVITAADRFLAAKRPPPLKP